MEKSAENKVSVTLYVDVKVLPSKDLNARYGTLDENGRVDHIYKVPMAFLQKVNFDNSAVERFLTGAIARRRGFDCVKIVNVDTSTIDEKAKRPVVESLKFSNPLFKLRHLPLLVKMYFLRSNSTSPIRRRFGRILELMERFGIIKNYVLENISSIFVTIPEKHSTLTEKMIVSLLMGSIKSLLDSGRRVRFIGGVVRLNQFSDVGDRTPAYGVFFETDDENMKPVSVDLSGSTDTGEIEEETLMEEGGDYGIKLSEE